MTPPAGLTPTDDELRQRAYALLEELQAKGLIAVIHKASACDVVVQFARAMSTKI